MSNTNDLNNGDTLGYDRPSRPGMQWYRFKFWSRRYWWIVALTTMAGLGAGRCADPHLDAEVCFLRAHDGNGRINMPAGDIMTRACSWRTSTRRRWR